MKTFLFFLVVFTSFGVHASGGVVCYDKAKKISVAAILGHTAGDPISDLNFTKNNAVISVKNDRIVQYKSNDNEFYLLVLNEDQSQVLFELTTQKKMDPNGRATKGTLIMKNAEKAKWKVVCDFE